ncbi:MAG: thioredoxin [Hymenobacter sp.]|nr:MAG: thioredoxin [Hymenobacter sp.]
MLVAPLPLLHLPPADTAVLLVLLPRLAGGAAQQGRTTTRTQLDTLQRRLGTAMRILVVDETTDPDVVRSFRVPALPAFLLVRQGTELWRQPGLPEGERIVEQLLRRASSQG